jgi:hypothetical protein
MCYSVERTNGSHSDGHEGYRKATAVATILD